MKAQNKIVKKAKPAMDIVNANLSSGAFQVSREEGKPVFKFKANIADEWTQASIDIAQRKEVLVLEKSNDTKEIEA